MPDPDFIAYLKTLKPEDWDKKATSKWTVKDVIAHMVGWERGDVETIKNSWETKTVPWWKIKNDDDAFNAEWVAYYKDYTSQQLIAEWEKWQNAVTEQIEKIGYENLQTRPDLFDWLFEGIDDTRSDGKESHYMHHYLQIKKVVEQN
jgi:hypothetical protein